MHRGRTPDIFPKLVTRDEARRITANIGCRSCCGNNALGQGADGATPLPPGFEAAPRPGWRLRGLGPPAAEV
jgi:hypothetical protein